MRKRILHNKKELSVTQYYLSLLGLSLVNTKNYKILKKSKLYRNEEEYENVLNELANYVFDGDRVIVYHNFRKFPYINHFKPGEGKGTLEHYTVSDVVFTCLILNQQRCTNKGIRGIDVEQFKEITKKSTKVSDCPINEMRAEILKILVPNQR